MAIKKNELKAMKEDQLRSQILESKKELMKLKSQVSRGTPPENPGKIRSIKKGIARMLTMLNMKKIGGAK
jgi:large subunit ribosomal protein L29